MATELHHPPAAADGLLTADDPPPARIVHPDGRSPFLLIGDHAGNRIPARLGTLGIGDDDRARHIGWDIGIDALGTMLAASLDAPFVAQAYSRLVVDCNRAPDAPDAIVATSDGTAIPGNMRLTDDDRAARLAAIHRPYHAAIAAEITRRDAAEMATVLVALHSFTPVMGTAPRPWHVGVLHDRGDPRFALACLGALRRHPELVVGDNQPYSMDGIDYSVPRHAYPERRRYVEIEVRQDLLADRAGVARWSDILAGVLAEALCAD